MAMRRFSFAACAASAALVLSACGGDAATGPTAAEADNRPPYGPGFEVGTTYDYLLYTHCGIEWARIDGAWWRTEPIDDGNANPPAGWGNPYDRGELIVVDRSTARYISRRNITVEFKRTNSVEAPIVCG